MFCASYPAVLLAGVPSDWAHVHPLLGPARWDTNSGACGEGTAKFLETVAVREELLWSPSAGVSFSMYGTRWFRAGSQGSKVAALQVGQLSVLTPCDVRDGWPPVSVCGCSSVSPGGPQVVSWADLHCATCEPPHLITVTGGRSTCPHRRGGISGICCVVSYVPQPQGRSLACIHLKDHQTHAH